MAVLTLDRGEGTLGWERGLIPLLWIGWLLVSAEATLCILRLLWRLLIAVLRITLWWCSILRYRWSAVLRLALGLVVILFAVAEVNVVGNDLCGPTLIAFLVSPDSDLKSAGYYHHSPLAKILIHKLCGISPGYAVDEVCFFLLPLRCTVPIYCHREAGNSNTAVSSPKLRITGQATHDCDMI